MIILEDDLEKLMVSRELTELTLDGYQDLSERLQQLQPHMQASTSCWEDTVSQVERMLRRANACTGEPTFSHRSFTTTQALPTYLEGMIQILEYLRSVPKKSSMIV